MWLLSYRFHCVLMLIVSVLTALAVAFGDAYADVLLDHLSGARPDILSMKVLAAVRWQHLLIPVIGIFFYPFVAVCIAYRLPRTRLLFIAFALFFLWLELDAIGGGGDRKGCEECGLSLFFYGLAFPLLYPLIMGVALGLQFFRARRLPPDPARKVDKALAATAGVFSLLMLGALWWYVFG